MEEWKEKVNRKKGQGKRSMLVVGDSENRGNLQGKRWEISRRSSEKVQRKSRRSSGEVQGKCRESAEEE